VSGSMNHSFNARFNSSNLEHACRRTQHEAEGNILKCTVGGTGSAHGDSLGKCGVAGGFAGGGLDGDMEDDTQGGVEGCE